MLQGFCKILYPVVIYLLRARLSTLILKGNQFLMFRRATITTLQAKAIVRTLIMMATLLLEKNLQETEESERRFFTLSH